jgi:hypothetical protein
VRRRARGAERRDERARHFPVDLELAAQAERRRAVRATITTFGAFGRRSATNES